MSRGYFMVSTCHNMRVDAYTHRNICPVLVPELLQDGYVIDVDPHSQFNRFINLLHGDTIGGVKNFLRLKTSFQSKRYLLYRYRIQSRSQSLE